MQPFLLPLVDPLPLLESPEQPPPQPPQHSHQHQQQQHSNPSNTDSQALGTHLPMHSSQQAAAATYTNHGTAEQQGEGEMDEGDEAYEGEEEGEAFEGEMDEQEDEEEGEEEAGGTDVKEMKGWVVLDR